MPNTPLPTGYPMNQCGRTYVHRWHHTHLGLCPGLDPLPTTPPARERVARAIRICRAAVQVARQEAAETGTGTHPRPAPVRRLDRPGGSDDYGTVTITYTDHLPSCPVVYPESTGCACPVRSYRPSTRNRLGGPDA